jgi:hypothetical protein
MKTLRTRVVYIDNSGRPIPIDFSKTMQVPNGTRRLLEISWDCSICNSKVSHRSFTKPTYAESDVVAIATAAFNLAFYECKCTNAKSAGIAKSIEPIGEEASTNG